MNLADEALQSGEACVLWGVERSKIVIPINSGACRGQTPKFNSGRSPQYARRGSAYSLSKRAKVSMGIEKTAVPE